MRQSWRMLHFHRILRMATRWGLTIHVTTPRRNQVTPGFSEEEPESDDDGPFRSAGSLKIIAERGARLTTFTLRVSSPIDGSVAGVYQVITCRWGWCCAHACATN